jgi:hypothetical protein
MLNGHIWLLGQIIHSSICAIIVHKKEMIHSHFAVVVQKIRQANFFVPQSAEHQNIVFTDLIGAIGNTGQSTTLAERTNAPTLALKPQPI